MGGGEGAGNTGWPDASEAERNDFGARAKLPQNSLSEDVSATFE